MEEALDGMQRAGYQAIELCHIPGMGEHVELGREASYYQEVKGKLDAAGLALDSIGASGSLGNERFEPVVKAAAALGAATKLGCLGAGASADLIALTASPRAEELYEAVVHHHGPVWASLIDGTWAIPPGGTAA